MRKHILSSFTFTKFCVLASSGGTYCMLILVLSACLTRTVQLAEHKAEIVDLRRQLRIALGSEQNAGPSSLPTT